MCGLAGAFHYGRESRVDRKALTRASNALRHRGPDRGGVWISPRGEVGLAHRRLSIVDLSQKADQPLASEDGNVRVVFNGEIYNHQALRAELESKGHRFCTHHSDAEVIVHAFEQWGIECLTRLRGMFAFALWDASRRELRLVRDRMGVKPLYYAALEDRFVFASEAGPLLDHLGVKREVSPQAVYHYLTFLTVPAPDCMYRRIRKLEAGTALKVEESGRMSVRRYWDPAAHLNNPRIEDPEQAEAIVDAMVEDAVLSHTAADVPLATTLSGGMDSGLVAAILKKRRRSVFAVVMDYRTPSPFSEAEAARRVAAQLGVDLEVRVVGEREFFTEFDRYCRLQADLPAGAPDFILLHLLARRMRECERMVCVLGEGADELGGYPSYFDLDREHPELAGFASQTPEAKQAFFRTASQPDRLRFDVARGTGVVPRKHIQSFSELEKSWLWNGGPVESSYAVMEKLASEIRTGTDDEFLRRVSNLEFKLRLPEFMLPRVDYSTMLASVEARVPFLDHELVEYCLGLPFELKMRDGRPKHLFRKALARRLDEGLIANRKIGFGRVLTPMLEGALPALFERRILRKPDHPLYAFVRPEAVRDLWSNRLDRPNGSFKLWTLFALGQWLMRRESSMPRV